VSLVRLLATLALLAVALALPAPAEVFKWTDSAGRVHYGDKPPEDAKSEQLKLQVQSYDGPAKVMDWAAILHKKAPEVPATANVVMYSTSWCPHCKRARAYFAQNGIAYQDIDVEKSAAGKRDFAALGGGGVPLIVVGGKAMRGFDPARMDRLLERP
jgi:glutaredoxin